MYRPLHIFLLLGTSLSTMEYTQRLENEAGIYYEQLQDVHLVQDEWKLITFFDLKSIMTQLPAFTRLPLNVTEKECYPFLADRCANLINKEEVIRKATAINKYLTFIRKLDRLALIETDRLPLSFIGKAEDLLSTNVPEIESKYYNEQINELYRRGKDIITLPKGQAQIIKSPFQLIDEHIQLLELYHDKSWNLARQTFRIRNGKIQEQDLVQILEWRNNVNLVADAYLSRLGTIVDIIYSAKLGLLHPILFSPEALNKIISDFNETQKKSKFPMYFSNGKIKDLTKISRFTVTYQEGKILIVISIPLTNPNPYTVYKLHSYPTTQIVGNYIDGSIEVHPKLPRLIVSWNLKQYTLIPEKDLQLCPSLHNFRFCEPKFPILNFSSAPICETLLVVGTHSQIAKDCDIRIMKKQPPCWKRLESTGHWLFSLPSLEQINLKCKNATRKFTIG